MLVLLRPSEMHVDRKSMDQNKMFSLFNFYLMHFIVTVVFRLHIIFSFSLLFLSLCSGLHRSFSLHNIIFVQLIIFALFLVSVSCINVFLCVFLFRFLTGFCSENQSNVRMLAVQRTSAVQPETWPKRRYLTKLRTNGAEYLSLKQLLLLKITESNQRQRQLQHHHRHQRDKYHHFSRVSSYSEHTLT